MTRRITLIRHAETEANVSGAWQGQSPSDLTAAGRAQIDVLAHHLDPPALLVSSDLDRAVATAEAIGPAELDPRWREFDFGAWDGLHPEEIERRYPEQFAELRAGADFAPAGGERASEFAARIQQALAAVAARLDEDEEAVVITHGGVIQVLVAGLLAVDFRGALALPDNTSATTIVLDGDRRPQVYTFNDAAHLGGDRSTQGARAVVLYRHGETVANIEHRWHGQGETPLTERGLRQAADLADHARPLGRIASSPLSRARLTAESVAATQGRSVEIVEDLIEIDFGGWEGMTVEEIEAADPERFHRIYRDGIDDARGGSGETFGQAAARFAAAVGAIAANGDDGAIGLFTHGGVSRAYIAGVLGIPFAARHALPVLRNTAHAEVLIGPGRTRLVSWNVAPHLER